MLVVLHSRSFVVGKLRLSPFVLGTLLLHFDFYSYFCSKMDDENWWWTDLDGCDGVPFRAVKHSSKNSLRWYIVASIETFFNERRKVAITNRFIFFVKDWKGMQNNFRFCRQQQLISDLRYEDLDVANFPKLQIRLEKLQRSKFLLVNFYGQLLTFLI